jgi:hypothetical protein
MRSEWNASNGNLSQYVVKQYSSLWKLFDRTWQWAGIT